MKKIITLALLALSLSSYSQIYVSGGIDIKNLVSGSRPTDYNGEINGLITAHLVSNNVEVTATYEGFKAIGFERYAIGVGGIFNRQGWVSYNVRLEGNQILRNQTKLNSGWGNTSSHLSLGVIVGARLNINDNISIGLQTSLLQRTDLKARYSEIHSKAPIIVSNYVTLYIKVFDPKKIR